MRRVRTWLWPILLSACDRAPHAERFRPAPDRPVVARVGRFEVGPRGLASARAELSRKDAGADDADGGLLDAVLATRNPAPQADVPAARHVWAEYAVDLAALADESPGLDPRDARRLRRVLAERLIDRDFVPRITTAASMKDLRDEYQRRIYEYVKPLRLHVEHALVADEATARTLWKSIVSKRAADGTITAKRFTALAKKAQARIEDLPPFVADGSLWRARGSLVPAFVKPAFALAGRAPGSVIEPIHTQFGWHLMRLIESKPASSVSFEAALPDVRARFLRDAGPARFRAWYEAIEKKHSVVWCDGGHCG